MTYENAIKYIKDTGKFGSKLGLEVMTCLLEKMGNPQDRFKAVHVAGTNGKGSTSSYISHILMKAGYKQVFLLHLLSLMKWKEYK